MSSVPVCVRSRISVVVVPLAPDLCRHAVKTLRAAFRTCQRHVRNRTGNPAIAIVERVNRDEPEVGEPGGQHLVCGRDAAFAVDPLEERSHVGADAFCCRGFVVDALAPERTGNDLHGSVAVVTPIAHAHLSNTAEATRKQRTVPTEQPVGRERGVVVACRVEHHLDDAFNPTIRRHNRTRVDAQTTGDRGTDLSSVESLALDIATLDDVFSECLEHRLLLKREAEGLHAP